MIFAEYTEKIYGAELTDLQKKIFESYAKARKEGKTLTICFGKCNGRVMVQRMINEFNDKLKGK